VIGQSTSPPASIKLVSTVTGDHTLPSTALTFLLLAFSAPAQCADPVEAPSAEETLSAEEAPSADETPPTEVEGSAAEEPAATTPSAEELATESASDDSTVGDSEPTTDESAPPETAFIEFRQALVAAKTLYFQGDDRARVAFEQLRLRLAAGETPPVQLQAEALIYLGELYYQVGRTADAKSAFNDVLALDPDFPISPYEHPMEVVGMFEMLRRGITRPPPPPEVAPRKRLPAWGYLPFGAAQFRQGRRGQGIFYACLQGALAATSVGTFAHLHRINGGDFPSSWSEQEVGRRVQLQRYAIQWPATIGFYAAWGASVYEGSRTWDGGSPVSAAGIESRREELRVAINYRF
jgi:tetratricopeptide (TPR) repeat protein